ncbi:MAG: hypothetical protein LQ348_007097 [Seirophora lacunosa]|nr:MAG: hypothetical protein LQ348_007097 [Seirophora lacunosa]
MSSEPLPPLQPVFVLRGHSVHVHAVHFTSGNTRLLTGDADGWVVSWNLAFKRPVAVWKAHETALLGIGSWGHDRIITHGRDSRLAVWQLGTENEEGMAKTLPVDKPSITSPHPWLLHMLTVNTLNFCSFAMCLDGIPQPHNPHVAIKAKRHPPPILVAVPNTIDSGGIDIHPLPAETRAAAIHADRNVTTGRKHAPPLSWHFNSLPSTGMVMALAIQAESTRLQVAAGYESGHTMVFVQSDPGAQFQRLYCARPHSQPVLSMAILPSRDCYVTSAADAVVAKHPLPAVQGVWKTELKPLKLAQTKHSGQQGLQARSDGKIFATAGWDSRVRVYSTKTVKELAVLKWHKVGCYTTAFADVVEPVTTKTEDGVAVKEEEESTDDDGESIAAKGLLALSTVQQRRDTKAHTTHWLAVGSKDGKVSLWDIY